MLSPCRPGLSRLGRYRLRQLLPKFQRPLTYTETEPRMIRSLGGVPKECTGPWWLDFAY
jgi:hypothetical protein